METATPILFNVGNHVMSRRGPDAEPALPLGRVRGAENAE